MVDLNEAAAQLANGVDPSQILKDLFQANANGAAGNGGNGDDRAPAGPVADPGAAMPNGLPANAGPSDTDRKRSLDAALAVGGDPMPEPSRTAAAAGVAGFSVPGTPGGLDPASSRMSRGLGDPTLQYTRDLGTGAPPPPGGPALPNGNPTAPPPGAAPSPAATAGASGAMPPKNTFEFYQGAYTPGKGVADKDGTYIDAYHSEANVINNARNGDLAAYAKLEVMADAGNGTAKSVLADLGNQEQFAHSQLHNDWIPGHNKEINTELANGAYAKNAEARANLGAQREVPVQGLETLKESNPQAAEFVQTLADLSGRSPQFDERGVTWVDTEGAEHRVAIGQIADANAKLQEAVNAAADKAAKQKAADAAGKVKK